MSQKKIEKEFCLTDNSINCYGFRLLTEGYQLAEFKKNPIGYHMHDRDKGVVLRWEDFRTEGDKVYAKPVVNLSHPRGQQTVDEIENGFLNGASVGHIVVLEASEDPADMVPGQYGPTITKWFNRECSLVDIPGNFSGLCLFDKEGKEIALAAFSPKPTTPDKSDTSMSKILLTAGALAALNLGATATDADVQTAVTDLVARNKTLVEDLAAAKASATAAQAAQASAEQTLADLKAETTAAKVKDLLDAASASGKITNELRADLEADYATEPGKLENLLSKMPAYKSITSQLSADSKSDAPEDLAAEYEKHWKEGTLEDLKAKNPERYEALQKGRKK